MRIAAKATAQFMLTLAISIVVVELVGRGVYAMMAGLTTILVFALSVTSDARIAASADGDVQLRPMPWGPWMLWTAVLAILCGMFWSVLPVALAWGKASASAARRREATRAAQTREASLTRVEDAQKREQRDQARREARAKESLASGVADEHHRGRDQ